MSSTISLIRRTVHRWSYGRQLASSQFLKVERKREYFERRMHGTLPNSTHSHRLNSISLQQFTFTSSPLLTSRTLNALVSFTSGFFYRHCLKLGTLGRRTVHNVDGQMTNSSFGLKCARSLVRATGIRIILKLLIVQVRRQIFCVPCALFSRSPERRNEFSLS